MTSKTHENREAMPVAPLDIKGVTLGTGRPKTIVSVMAKTPAGLADATRRAVDVGADIVEWRVDYLDLGAGDDAVARAADALAGILTQTPLIATVRTRGQGGEIDLDGASYISLCRHLVATRAIDVLDIELCWGDQAVSTLAGHAHDCGVRTIVSEHDFCRTPPTDQMVDTLAHMAALGADVAKLAVWATSPQDACRLMEATAIARERLHVPLITMGMGTDGIITRLAGETFGSAATFCALDAPSAPGQVALTEARELLARLSDALRTPTAQA